MKTGDKIKKLRAKKGLTQQQLADRCELNKNSISMYERNNIQPKMDTLKKIAGVLDVDLSELISMEEIYKDFEKDIKKDIEKNSKETVIQVKRREVPFDIEKITAAINKSFEKAASKAVEEALAGMPTFSKTDEALMNMEGLFESEGYTFYYGEEEGKSENAYVLKKDDIFYKLKKEDIKGLYDATSAFFSFHLKNIITNSAEIIDKSEISKINE